MVHTDPELEADVFEELDPDLATRLFGDKTDAEVADVITHMRADDAADAVAELPQARRQKILDLLPAGTRAKVLTLLGFNATSAGGIMGVDFLAAPADVSVDEALRRVRLAENIQQEALVTIHVVDEANRLVGTVSIIGLLHADPGARLGDVDDSDPVRVTTDGRRRRRDPAHGRLQPVDRSRRRRRRPPPRRDHGRRCPRSDDP